MTGVTPDGRDQPRADMLPVMTSIRIALANIEIPEGPEDALERALVAIAQAADAGARVVCFPEAYVLVIRGVRVALITWQRAFCSKLMWASRAQRVLTRSRWCSAPNVMSRRNRA